MPRRRLVRFVLEVAFLAGLATLATVARMRAEAVVAVMVFGWVVVALSEWSSWLDRPHFGRGLPPRFCVPQVSLPPPEPIEQRSIRLPSGGRRVEDEETWIASSTDWSTAFDDWPVVDLERLGEDTGIARQLPPGADTDAGTLVVAPDEPSPERDDEPAVREAAEESQPPGGVALPAPPVEIRAREAAPLLDATPAPVQGPGREVGLRDGPPPAPIPAPMRARHRIDPFAPPGRARRWRRRHDQSGVVEVADRPPPGRPLPDALVRALAEGPR